MCKYERQLEKRLKAEAKSNATSAVCIEQKATASRLGAEAQARGECCAPGANSALMSWMRNAVGSRQIGETPKGEAQTVEILKAWKDGYRSAIVIPITDWEALGIPAPSRA